MVPHARPSLTERGSAALLLVPALLTVLLTALAALPVAGAHTPLLAAALGVAATCLLGVVAVRAVVAVLLTAIAPAPPRRSRVRVEVLPQNEPAAVGNPQPRAPGAPPLPRPAASTA